jgi:hypothetical protein
VPSEINLNLLYSLGILGPQPPVDRIAQHDLRRTQVDPYPPKLLYPLLRSSLNPSPICDTPIGTNKTLVDASMDLAVGADCHIISKVSVFTHVAWYAALIYAYPSQPSAMHNDAVLVQTKNILGAYYAFKQDLKNLRLVDRRNLKVLQ